MCARHLRNPQNILLLKRVQLPGLARRHEQVAQRFAERGGAVPVFQNTRHLERWHWNTLGREGLHSVTYPKPPFPGTKWILPVTHSHILQRESREMHHCVVTYEKEIMQGQVAVYVVLHPQRATLGLQKNRDDTWRILDFRLPFNRWPRYESRRMVEDWLKQAQAG